MDPKGFGLRKRQERGEEGREKEKLVKKKKVAGVSNADASRQGYYDRRLDGTIDWSRWIDQSDEDFDEKSYKKYGIKRKNGYRA